MRERTVKGIAGIFYILLSLMFFDAGYRNDSNISGYIGFSALGLSLRAFTYVYIKWKEEEKLKNIAVRDCFVNYFLYYPLLVAVVFILVFIFSDKYHIVTPNFGLVSLLSFYVGFDIVSVANKIIKNA
ncbi:MAG: hypothetical protein JW847_07405 [Candidatus Omnitrophica bacterium]|nr:hypothetical protein [Candidatus Omnitrophota bacterium]